MDDDEYWNTSETKAKALSFDDDMLTPQEILAIGQRASFSSSQSDTDVLSGTTVRAPLLPLSSLVSSKVMELLILAQSGNDPSGVEKQYGVEDTVSTTLKRLVLGRTCSLYGHKSLKSKKELLDGAILIGDGNAILGVVLFLVRTLNRKIVYELLSSRPLALNHYISFLLYENKMTELTDLLTMLGRSPEAAMYQFQQHMKHQSTDIAVTWTKLNNLLSNHFSQPGTDAHQTKMINGFIKFLEWQKCVGNTELYNKSVLQCLAHCCRHNWNDGAGKMMSPLTLCQQQQISPMQYDWVALNVHATVKDWATVESLFTRKDWFGRATNSSHVSLPLVILRLHALGAGAALLATFINQLPGSNQRLEIAKQFKVHSVIIEVLAKQRDRTALTNYKMTLKPQSEEYFLAENTLRDSAAKWKN